MQSCMWSPRQYTVHFTVVSHSFCYVMRSESYMKGVETLHCEPTAIRWGRKTGTDHIRTGVQEVISCISHISGTNSVTNVTAALFTPYNISGWSFFFGYAPQNLYVVHIHWAARQWCACSLHARKESSHLHGVTMNTSPALNSLTFSGFLLLQYILRRSRNFGLLWFICWVALCEDKQRQRSHVFMLSSWE